MSRNLKFAVLLVVLVAAAHFVFLSWSWSAWQSDFKNYTFEFATKTGLTLEGGGLDPSLFSHPEFQPPMQSQAYRLLSFPIVNYSISTNGGVPTLTARIAQSIVWGFVGLWAAFALRGLVPKRQ